MTAAVVLVAPYDEGNFPENFYRGVIVRLERGRGRGVIRSHGGREVIFQFPFVSVVDAPRSGRMPGVELLHMGDEVGFDVGWTSKGLRITRIKPAVRTSTRTESASGDAGASMQSRAEQESTSSRSSADD